MSEEAKTDIVDRGFWEEIDWDKVAFNKIEKEDFLRARSLNSKLYATFLGSSEQLQFFMFRPLNWGKYKEIKSKNLDKDTTHEYILNACVVHPVLNPIEIGSLDAGIVLTLVNQILTVSNFIKNPDKALEMILELE